MIFSFCIDVNVFIYSFMQWIMCTRSVRFYNCIFQNVVDVGTTKIQTIDNEFSTKYILNVNVIVRRDVWVEDNCFPPKNDRNNQITVRSIHTSQSPSSAASFRDTLSIFNLVYSTRRRRKQCFTRRTVFYYFFFFFIVHKRCYNNILP